MLELKNITDGDIHNLSLGIKPGECITLLDSDDQIMDRADRDPCRGIRGL